MAVTKYKVESGIQLLARLARKPEIDKFYPVLFQSGPKTNEVIEMFGNGSTPHLLADIISEALIPIKFNGKGAGVLIFNTDGNLNFNVLLGFIRKKLDSRLQINKSISKEHTETDLNNCVRETICNLFILDIYDATQFYTTVYNLENILVEHSNISMIIFDTLTAFYWSEHGFKLAKMDLYIKRILKIIQKVSKEHNTTILYTRPDYLSSNIENLEGCCEHPTIERVNYRIQILSDDDECHKVNVRTFKEQHQNKFRILDAEIKWLL